MNFDVVSSNKISMFGFRASNFGCGNCARGFAAACNTPIGLPPFGKFSASSEKGGRASCKAADGYILTHKAWCAKQSDCKHLFLMSTEFRIFVQLYDNQKQL